MQCFFRRIFSPSLLMLISFIFPTSAFAEKTCIEYNKPEKTGIFANSKITESSGLAASQRYPNIWWTHNDSGSKARIYAFRKNGEDLGYFDVTGATNYDWEDIAVAPCPNGNSCIYIADVGDNEKKRSNIIVYRVEEPNVNLAAKNKGQTAKADVFTLKYPDGVHNCETFLVNPKTGDFLFVTKREDKRGDVYWLSGKTKPGQATLQKKGTLHIGKDDLFTGGSFSPNGDQVVLRTYSTAFIYTVGSDGIPMDINRLGEINPGLAVQGEAIGYSYDANYILTSSEFAKSPLYQLSCVAPPPKEEPPSDAGSKESDPPQDKGTPQDNGSPQDKGTPQDKGEEIGCGCSNLDGNFSVLWMGLFLLIAGMMRRRG